ncbi:hypothetical protein EGW08_003192, partial [Elysia chlorotica]
MDVGQTEYISRLTALRDSLIDQEQMYLAQALDRLRIHSLSNKSSSFRLRMHGDDGRKTTSPTGHAQTPRTTMMTTVEKIRQMRPKRHPPVIFPLQGRQLLDRQSQADRESPLASDAQQSQAGSFSTSRSAPDKAGGVTSRSGRDADVTARSLPSKVDETVRTNLQRLLKPSSSIPNIGRKAIRTGQGLEPKTRGLLNNSSSNSSSSRFITRPRVMVPRRPPSLVSPDTIIDAVTNYNNHMYSLGQHCGSSSGSNSNSNIHNNNSSNNNNSSSSNIHSNNNYYRMDGGIHDEMGSEGCSLINGAVSEVYHANSGSNNIYNKNNCNNNPSAPDAFQNSSNPNSPIYPSHSNTDKNNNNSNNNNNNNNNIIVIPGADGEYVYDQSQLATDLDSNVKVDAQRRTDKRVPSTAQNTSSVPAVRKLYRDIPGRTHRSNNSSVSASRSESQVGSSTVSSGYNTAINHRSSIDIYLPSSHPFGTPFARNSGIFSRENTTGSEGGFTRINTHNPSVEPIHPETRFPTISRQDRVDSVPGLVTVDGSGSGSRSRSNSNGDIGLSSRTQKTSSLPNVRSRYLTSRQRSNSGSGSVGFPDDSSTARSWTRVSHSQGGRRERSWRKREEEEEEYEMVDDNQDVGAGGILNSHHRRHIVIDMPSIILNAASPDVGIDTATATATPL